MSTEDRVHDMSSVETFAATRLQFDAVEMRRYFDKQPFLIEQHLTQHPLLQLEALINLSQQLPAASVEYNSGDLPLNQDSALTPQTGLSVEETLRRIEECNSWMVLKNVEQDSRYGGLLDECLDEVQPVIEEICPGMVERKAFIFISSPRSVTPFHVDFEYNFLLQIRGDKSMTVFDGQDRALLSEQARERAVNGAPRNLQFREEFALKGRTFHLRPGVGLHVPLSSPHWVKVGDGVSISFSITFHSKASDKIIGAHKINSMLRRFGWSPEQVGVSPGIDAIKYTAHRLIRKIEVTTARLRGA